MEYCCKPFHNDAKHNDLEEDCINAMKHWYCQDNKQYTNCVLDYLEVEQSIVPDKYMNIANVEGKHWITIKATILDGESSDPIVQSIDNYYTDDNNASGVRRWFAKYFGLFDDRYFDCHELVMEKNPSMRVGSQCGTQDPDRIQILLSDGI